MLLVLDPVVGVGVRWIDDLREDLVVSLHNQDGARVLMFAAVVSGRKNSNKGSTCEALEAIHHALVSTDDHVKVVLR